MSPREAEDVLCDVSRQFAFGTATAWDVVNAATEYEAACRFAAEAAAMNEPDEGREP